MNSERIRKLNTFEPTKGPVLYWMNRDMRIEDNWALFFAQQVAKQREAPLMIVYNLDPTFLGGRRRQLEFKKEILRELEIRCQEKNIAFTVLIEHETVQSLVRFCVTHEVGAVVTDMSPLRLQQAWVRELQSSLKVAFYQVDTHNCIPVWIASQKQEFGAYTIRPKIQKLLPTYLEEFPDIEQHPYTLTTPLSVPWADIEALCIEAEETPEYQYLFHGGSHEAWRILQKFMKERLPTYHEKRNDPNEVALSDLSPYLHYGCIAPARIALEVQKNPAPEEAKAAFLEELIVRRELSDNFCYYNAQYDSPLGYPQWAQKTHALHKEDLREYTYGLETFETGTTHDPLWNACQKEMLLTGKMHGYMRMYWAKKILEWTPSVAVAHEYALLLNDRYELDGRDPNGYVGIAWALGGVHDRAWVERDIFGQIRYMNYNGCKRKFDVDAYCATWNSYHS